MAKNRKIPFGYMMQNGVIVANPKEVLAVVTIFSQYLSGMSMDEIAKSMTVPYQEGKTWNKNMVKRILENEKYKGTDKYPQLISQETYERVNAKRISKATSLCVISEELSGIRNLTVCAECGCRLFRKGGNTRSDKWDCRNRECFPFDYRLTDQMLISAILNIFNSAIANPSLLQTGGTVSTYHPSSEIIRKQNEINHMMDSQSIEYDKVKTEILNLASMKYACCSYDDAPQNTKYLQKMISEQTQLNTIDIGLLKSCVKRILVSHCSCIEIEFINGIIIQNTTERSLQYGNRQECDSYPCKENNSG